MPVKPRLKIEMTRFDWAIEVVGFMIWIGGLLFLILEFENTPGSVPTHYDAYGNADAFGSKSSLWLLVGISTGLYLLLTVVAQYPHTFNYPIAITPENAERQYTIAVRMMRTLKIIVLMIFGYIHLNSIMSSQLGTWFLPVMSLALIVTMGFYFYKALAARK